MKNRYRAFTIRRLFKEDIPLIQKCYADFDFLHHNPVDSRFIESVMLSGSFWAVYDSDTVVAVSYMLPGNHPVFATTTAGWEIADLLDTDFSDSLVAGYVWVADNFHRADVFSAFCNLWFMQAVRTGRQNIIHYIPAHTEIPFATLFSQGFDLAGLRGLDNLVPHYIFIKNRSLKNNDMEIYKDVKSCPLSDTKTLSMLCENGHRAFDIDRQNNLLFRR